MTQTGSHPAVLAGLLGSAMWVGAPTVALASPVDDMVEAVSGSLLLQFVAGCAIGAAVAGVISLVADRLARDDEAEAEAEAASEGLPADDLAWSSSSLNLIAAEQEVGEDDPTGDLGRYRTGQITIDFPALAEQAVETAISGPRHFAPPSERRPERRGTRKAGRHFAGATKKAPAVQEKAAEVSATVAQDSAPVAPARRRGRHFAGATPEAKVAAASHDVRNPVAEAAPAATKDAAAPELKGRARLANLPTIEARHMPVRTPQKTLDAALPEVEQAIDALSDAAGLADLVSHEPLAERSVAPAGSRHASTHAQPKPGLTGRIRMQMATRAKGVRAVLAERLGRDALDGVPIIERADGTTLEVTPTWFDQTVVPALASITGVTPRIEDTAARPAEQAAPVRVATEHPSRASYIADRVAEVNVGVFPERRSGEDLERGDAWEEALAAMGEAIAQSNPPVFQDVVGGPSTIDDPDGLEGPTGFIPFRVPAAHPEVVDTETYVDYLLRDEISQNGSPVLVRSPHAHLRVIEGGTGRIRTRRHTGDTGPVRQGRHFAQPVAFAAEA